jgi:hypothetical protein
LYLKIAKDANEIRESLVESLHEIEKEFVTVLFDGISEDSKDAFSWLSVELEELPPPLEVISLWKNHP